VIAPVRCVIDASVGVKCLRRDEPLSTQARALVMRGRDVIGAGIVPGLFDLECAHAVVKLQRRTQVGRGEALQAIGLLHDLPVLRMPSRPLLPHAARFAVENGISAYDAVYVILAVTLGMPLVTADERLVRAMDGAPVEMVRLADIEV